MDDLLSALECPVCLEQLDATSRVLPCQHTFCRRCLLEIVHSRRELLCPECRVQCEVKVDDLPPNILLIRLLEGMKSNRKQSTDARIDSHNDLVQFGGHSAGPQSMAGLTINHMMNGQQMMGHSQPSNPNQTPPQQPQHPQHSLVKQLVPTPNSLPRAKALYNYDGKELEGDLSFKKGDIIILRKRIDQNWFHGELNNKSGFLPASYVQVLVPPPSPVPPQCKALYDFRVTDVEEKDCLSFAKNDVITVIRRVDENWAEGKLMDRIGIFPISFVEMNVSARALMKLASINTNTPSRCAPPAPITAATSPEPTTSGALLSAHNTAGTTTTVTTASGGTISGPFVSQSSLSHTTTVNSPPQPQPSSVTGVKLSSPSVNAAANQHTNTGPVVSVMPVTVSGPVLQSSALISTTCATTPVVPQPTPSTETAVANGSTNGNGINQKRHSLCSASPPAAVMIAPYHRSQSHVDQSSPPPLPTATSSQSRAHNQSLRHSMEMLNTSAADDDEEGGQWSTEFARTAVIRKSLRENSHRNGANNDLQCPPNENSIVTTQALHSSGGTSSAAPILYAALYSYRPQKKDELELKKGELYSVCEKCHDGWYKGVSVRNGSSGVFPGNYVQLAKLSTQLSQYPCPVNVSNKSQSILSANNSIQLQSGTQLAKEPPIPKPKPIIHAKPSTGGDAGTQQPMTNTTTTATDNTGATVYARPRPSGQPIYDASRNLSALVPPPPPTQRPGRPLSSILVPNTKSTEDQCPSPQSQLAQALNQSLLISKQQSASQSSLNQSSTQWHQPKVAATRNTISMATNTSSATAITPPPNVSVMSSSSSVMTPTSHRPPTDRRETKTKEKSSNFIKRFTSSSKPKRKHQMNNNNNNNSNAANNRHNNSFSCDNPSFVDTSPNNVAPLHIRSGSCPNESLPELGSHKKQSSFDDTNTVIKNRLTKSATKDSSSSSSGQSVPHPIAPPLVRERFRCVVPYPPNSEYELELQVGDIVYVHKKREDGWYKGTLQRTGKTGLFPGPFVEAF